MGIIYKLGGCVLAFSLIFLSYSQAEAKDKLIQKVSFYEPDYEVVEVVDVEYEKQISVQNEVNDEIRQQLIDINDDTESSLREPARIVAEPQDVSFESSYKQFQKHYGELSEELDL